LASPTPPSHVGHRPPSEGSRGLARQAPGFEAAMKRIASLDRVHDLQAECLANDLPTCPSMVTWTEDEVMNYFESGGETPTAPSQPKVWLISDLHIDKEANMQWLQSLPPCPNDYLVLPGDVCTDQQLLAKALMLLAGRFKKVFYTPGNHELWVTRREADGRLPRKPSAGSIAGGSFGKLETIRKICRAAGVSMDAEYIGDSCHGVWVVPLLSWYDLSLDLSKLNPELERFGGGFSEFSFSDLMLCHWPEDLEDDADSISGRYPTRVAEEIAKQNVDAINRVNAALKEGHGDGVISFSHFLPNEQTLPDWLVPSEGTFQREWLEHSSPSTQVLFSKVAGSRVIERQLREISADVGHLDGSMDSLQSCRHVHAFGHSHRPKDFELDGVHYVSAPMGYERERVQKVVPAEPTLKLIWDSSGPVPAPSRPLVRYWERHGGKEPIYARDEAFVNGSSTSTSTSTSTGSISSERHRKFSKELSPQASQPLSSHVLASVRTSSPAEAKAHSPHDVISSWSGELTAQDMERFVPRKTTRDMDAFLSSCGVKALAASSQVPALPPALPDGVAAVSLGAAPEANTASPQAPIREWHM